MDTNNSTILPLLEGIARHQLYQHKIIFFGRRKASDQNSTKEDNLVHFLQAYFFRILP